MISLKYLKYLFNSKKYLLLFVAILELLSIFSIIYKNEAIIMLFVMCFILSIIIPLDVFSYIHDKKAVDSYFALPISRKELLFTGLLFSLSVVCFYFGIGYLAIHLVRGSFTVTILLYDLVLLVGFICLIIFNTMLYQIGNSILDGVVMIVSYTALPLLIYCVLGMFFDSYVCGFISVSLDFEIYFSPVYMLISNFADIYVANGSFNSDYLIAQAIIIVISLVILYYSFINRKVERAGSVSKEVFAFPLVTNLYAFLLIMCVACNYSYVYDSFLYFFKENAILFLIIFALYVCSHFVYKRSFYFDIKIPAIFIGFMIICLSFACVARANDGFDLATTYNKKNINYYDYYDYDLKGELKNEVNSLLEEKSNWLAISITVNGDGDKAIDNEVINKFESLRQEAIVDYYNGEKCENGQLTIRNNYGVFLEHAHYSDEYLYHIENALNVNDIKELAKYDCVSICIDCDDGYYEMNKDGTLERFKSDFEVAYETAF